MELKEIILSLSRDIDFLEEEILRLDCQRRLLGAQKHLGGEMARYQWLNDLFILNEKIRNLKMRKDELQKRKFFLIREFIDKIEKKMKGGKNEKN
jgi:hypothetical protein